MDKKGTRTISRLANVSVDEIVARHLELLNKKQTDTPKGVFRQPNVLNTDIEYIGEPETPKRPQGKVRKPHTRELATKYEYLIHLIASRSELNKYGYATLNATILEAVFGKVYAAMLHTLTDMDIITHTSYEIGVHARAYTLSACVETEVRTIQTHRFDKYDRKLHELLKQQQTKQEAIDRKQLGDNNLYARYRNALSFIRLAYPNEAAQYIASHHFTTSRSKDYYIAILEAYASGNFTINQVDKNKRIYTILTRTPRSLKPFLNLSFSADIHNSHPLLFSAILLNCFHIPTSALNKIYDLISTTTPLTTSTANKPHNVRRYLRKFLKDNGINSSAISKIPIDVLEYIYLTSTGRFWDEVIPEELLKTNSLLRQDIKILMFREVFYSKNLNARGKEYAKLFRKRFPNVYKVVRMKKKESPDKKGLPNEMMAMESELFHEILRKLYAKHFQVVNIHDAIVVLDVKENDGCTKELVSEIITKVYRKHGLMPTVSVDMYGEEHMMEVMAKEASLNREIERITKELKEDATKGDADAATILNDIDNGKVEFRMLKDGSVILHPIDI